MPLDLHTDCKARLLEVLITALSGIQTQHGMFLESRSAAALVVADFVLPKAGRLHDRLKRFPSDLNRRDSQRVKYEPVFVH
jgi:hypothetical protein